MVTYLAETYLSRERGGELSAATARLEAAAMGQVATRHVRSYFVQADETCIHVIEAPSLAAAEALVRHAGITADRIVEASSEGPGASG